MRIAGVNPPRALVSPSPQYPFATQNKADYANLLAVYSDAVFFPRLRDRDFFQEGWRLERKNAGAAAAAAGGDDGDLEFKGVVFNEMKGRMSDTGSLFYQRFQEALLPGTPYAFNSGGDPLAVLDLTPTRLRAFHARHYHPGRARFYSYGDMPLEDHLAHVDAAVLARWERPEGAAPVVAPVQRWTAPRRAHFDCPPGLSADEQRQSTVLVASVVGEVSDVYEVFVMSFLSANLLSGPQAPLQRAFLEAGLGADFAPGTGFAASYREGTFGVGLQGVRAEDVPAVERIVAETLERVAAEGLDAGRIESLLHQTEMSMKKVTSSYGLNSIMGYLMPLWIHGGNPVEPFDAEPVLARFRAEGPAKVLQDRLRRWLLPQNNPHQLVATMSPAADYIERQDAAEAALLKTRVDALSAEEVAEIDRVAAELRAEQDEPKNFDCLPTMTVADIAVQGPTTSFDVQDSTHWLCAQPTNGISYLRAAASLEGLPEELVRYVPIFASILSQAGAGERDFREFSAAQEAATGGIGASVFTASDWNDPTVYKPQLMVSGSALERNVGTLAELMGDLVEAPRLSADDEATREHVRSTVVSSAKGLEQSIADSGHSLAKRQALAAMGGPGSAADFKEKWEGLEQVEFMMGLVKDGQVDVDDVLDKCRQIAHFVMRNADAPMRTMATAREGDALAQAHAGLERIVQRASNYGGDVAALDLSLAAEATPSAAAEAGHQEAFRGFPIQVNHCSRVFAAPASGHVDSAPLSVLSRMMSLDFLHREIREKGGAYGGGAQNENGAFAFYSYYDPNLGKTLDTFRAGQEWARNAASFTDADIDEAKIGVFSGIDKPTAPRGRGLSRFISGVTDAQVQERREQLLGVTRAQVQDVAARYLGDDVEAFTAVVGIQGADVPEGFHSS